MALLIRSDSVSMDSLEKVEPENGKTFSLSELQAYVDGYIEIKKVCKFQKMLVMNEEGKLYNMPPNPLATKLFQEQYGPIDVIVGDCLLCEISEIE